MFLSAVHFIGIEIKNVNIHVLLYGCQLGSLTVQSLNNHLWLLEFGPSIFTVFSPKRTFLPILSYSRHECSETHLQDSGWWWLIIIGVVFLLALAPCLTKKRSPHLKNLLHSLRSPQFLSIVSCSTEMLLLLDCLGWGTYGPHRKTIIVDWSVTALKEGRFCGFKCFLTFRPLLSWKWVCILWS